MDENTFNLLLNLVGYHLQKQNTVMRQAISAEERLIATLRFLATGRSYEDLKYFTCIAAQTLGQLIPETCQVIYNVLKEKYMKFPTTKQEWIETAQGFKYRCQMINCGGALDGKHIRTERPALSGAQYYNYKNFYSIVLMALVNSNYEFVYVDVGK
ncbi:unnamed protein product [Acanthoscelides obtectus]|uniref:DDE Tnp4 domain-containing protein n=1 Tax=Acanthoscelides obtectus TaxID=200917 RepID=A0A9P0M0Y6_ACAOB|nr:unnamed protein product [Acanthoscelides obtectus]CAK1663155.1 hypothetical protein AOBTE_LOCUS23517 [Acanthoscelides obtectus]